MSAPVQEAPSWTDAATAVSAAVDVLAHVSTTDLADAQLAAALEHAAVQASRLQAVAAGVVAEADSRRAWRRQGASSLHGWVRRCVQLADDAARLVAAARMRALMPRTTALFTAGKISLAQMGTAARQVRRLPDVPSWPVADAGSVAQEDGRHGPASGVGCPDPDAAQPSQPGTVRWADLRSAADEILAERAVVADARTLAAIGEQIFAAADPGEHLGEALSRHERRHLSVARSFEGMGEVTGRLDPEATERAITVLTALATKAGPDDYRTAAQRRADAFDTLCKAWLASSGVPLPPRGVRRRERLIVTIPYQTLIGLPGAPAALLGGGTPIPAVTARRLACDGSVRRVIVAPPAGQGPGDRIVPFDMRGLGDGRSVTGCRDDGQVNAESLAEILRSAIAALPPPLGTRSAVLDAGRAAPAFTSPMRDALHAEFGGRCAFPRCDKAAAVIHHLVPWALGGRTSVTNGAPLCEYHHYLVHEGGWSLTKDARACIAAQPPPPIWPGQRRYWRKGRPIAGPPPDGPPPDGPPPDGPPPERRIA